jgi:hypothetical protein
MSEPEPALFSDRIVGLRRWRVLPDGRLVGLAKSLPWPVDEPLEAECIHACHYAPAPDCSCGAYAYHPSRMRLRSLARREAPPLPVVSGAVAAWGRVEVHLQGFRAEFARPVAFFAREDAPPLVRRLSLRASARNGVRLIRVRDDVEAWEQCVEHGWTGLARKTVSDLVVEATEVVLIPEARGFLGRGDAPIAESGFVPVPCRRGQSLVDGAGRRTRFVPGTEAVDITVVPEFEDELQHGSFAPGRAVSLVPDQTPIDDMSALAVRSEDGIRQAGWVFGTRARRIQQLIAEGAVRDARVVWQERCMATGRRTGLRVLVSRCPVRLATDAERPAAGERRR